MTSTQPELVTRLCERRTRPGYTPLQAMALSWRVGEDFLRSSFFEAECFLVYYERPDLARHNRLHIVPREELIAFLNDRIRPDRGEGLDLTVTTFEMAEFLLTSHDGDLFYRMPAEWPVAGH